MNPALPILGALEIASPCDASWEAMTGDDRRRFCGDCEKYVYNLPLLEPEELVELIEKTEGNFCGRLYARRDGTVLTDDCPVGLQAKLARARRKNIGAAAAVGALMVAAGAALFAAGWCGVEVIDEDVMLGGEISVPPPAMVTTTFEMDEETPPPPPKKPGRMLMGKIRPTPTK